MRRWLPVLSVRPAPPALLALALAIAFIHAPPSLLAAPPAVEDKAEDKVITRIAFGSCAHQEKPQPIWDAVLATRPDLFVFLGDNIYGDTEDMGILANKYAQLGEVPGFRKLRESDDCRVLATWDDHDYGKDDAGDEYPMREASQRVFLDFWNDPPDSARRKRPGVYASYLFGPPGKRVQVILLDTRYFRSPLVKIPKPEKGKGPYLPDTNPSVTMLGEAQWAWLEEQLRVPADLRVIGSSIQVVPTQHGWEKWENFPRERQRLFDLIRKTKANGVVLLSGDRHFAEISREPKAVGYPLYDLTASSINRPGKGDRVEPNVFRVGDLYEFENFGLLTIDWSAKDPAVEMTIRGMDGKPVVQETVRLSTLNAPPATGE